MARMLRVVLRLVALLRVGLALAALPLLASFHELKAFSVLHRRSILYKASFELGQG